MQVGAVMSSLPATWLTSHYPLTEWKKTKEGNKLNSHWCLWADTQEKLHRASREKSERMLLYWLYLFISFCLAPCGRLWPTSFPVKPMAEGRRGSDQPLSLSSQIESVTHSWGRDSALLPNQTSGVVYPELLLCLTGADWSQALELCATDLKKTLPP